MRRTIGGDGVERFFKLFEYKWHQAEDFRYCKVAGHANNAGNSHVIAVFTRGHFISIVFLPEHMIPVDWYPSDGLNQATTEASNTYLYLGVL